jgi:hypothetical protein
MNAMLPAEVHRFIHFLENFFADFRPIAPFNPHPVIHRKPDEVESPFGDGLKVLLGKAVVLAIELFQQIESAPTGQLLSGGVGQWGGCGLSRDRVETGNSHHCASSSGTRQKLTSGKIHVHVIQTSLAVRLFNSEFLYSNRVEPLILTVNLINPKQQKK